MKKHKLIEKVGGIDKAREIVTGAKVFWFAYDTIDGEYMSGGDIQDGFSIEDYEGCIVINDLRTAIAEQDAVTEFNKGDYVTGTWGLEKGVFKITLKPRMKAGVLYLPLTIGGVVRDCLAQWYRHATPSEIAAGHREPLGNPEQLDDVVDINYHVSPLTVITELHVSEALRLNKLG